MRTLLALALAIGALVAPAPARSAQRAPAARFAVVDVFVEAGAPLAAWQVDVAARGDGQVVGVEGGEAPLDQPPYYDPAALQQGRIVLAAFTTAAALPAGRHRVASLHVREVGPPVEYQATLQAAGDPTGARIAARVSLVPRRGEP